MRRRRAREYALQMLFQLDMTGSTFTEEVSREFWDEIEEDPEVKEFANSLVRGTMENIDTIDGLLTEVAERWSLDRMATVDRNILRCATYELLYRDDIPPAVSINEAIEIAKKYSTEESAAFINGILDKIQKSRAQK